MAGTAVREMLNGPMPSSRTEVEDRCARLSRLGIQPGLVDELENAELRFLDLGCDIFDQTVGAYIRMLLEKSQTEQVPDIATFMESGTALEQFQYQQWEGSLRRVLEARRQILAALRCPAAV